jgi:hypothetical protein
VSRLDQKASYRIRIEESVDGDLLDWYEPMEVLTSTEAGGFFTTLAGIVTDQAGLVGLIRHLHGLGLTLRSVERLSAGSASPASLATIEEQL